MTPLISMAFHNLLQARKRTTLLAAALVFVSCLLTMLLALSRGLSDTLIDNLTTLSTGHVNVTGFYKVRPTNATPIIPEPAAVRAVIRKSVPEAVVVVERLMGWAKVVGEKNSVTAEIAGVDIAAEPFLSRNLRVAREEEYISGGSSTRTGNLDALARPGTVALFASQAKRMGVRVGDAVSMVSETAGGVQNVLSLQIGVILQDRGMMSNFLVLADAGSLRQLYNLKSEARGAFLIYLPHRDQASAILTRLRDDLKKAGLVAMDYDPAAYFMKFDNVASEDWTGQRYDLTTWSDYGSFLLWIVTALDTLSLIIVSTISAIVSVGVFNSIWMSVRERTAELGTLRAIGMQRRQVLALVLLEGGLLAASASLLGAGLGLAAAAGLNALRIPIESEAMRSIIMGDTLRLTPHWGQALASLILCEVVVALSALWPALKASRTAPATAIRHAT